MKITEVTIMAAPANTDRVMAFASICLDGVFVVRDLKIIDGGKGLFVAMPSRKLADHCAHCGSKNHLKARFCNHCGGKLDEHRAAPPAEGRVKLHADTAHPITAACREALEAAVVDEYRRWSALPPARADIADKSAGS